MSDFTLYLSRYDAPTWECQVSEELFRYACQDFGYILLGGSGHVSGPAASCSCQRTEPLTHFV